jgi:CheY-like chemotaxis protein
VYFEQLGRGSTEGAGDKAPDGSGHTMLPVLLIVDDDEDMRTTMTEMVEVGGYICLSATSGSEGLRLLQSERPVLVILDFRLPDMDATQFLLRKASMPSVVAVPVIIVTGYRKIPMPHGAVAQLDKPFDIDELLTEIKKHIAPTVEPEPEAPTARWGANWIE